MSTATADKRTVKTTEASQAIQEFREARLPYHPIIETRFGIDKSSWKALVEAIFPNATSTDSVILALSYCRARNLDPFKRNVHIVPIWSKALERMVDSIWPGIGELRTTAFRTGAYAGKDRTAFGLDISQKIGTASMTFPEWAEDTVYRIVQGSRVAFVGPKVYWLETYAEQKRGDLTPNEMWRDRPRGQLAKCSEAAALRAAFPEECGGESIPEEVERGGAPQGGKAHSSDRLTLDSLSDRLTNEKPKTQEPAEKATEQPKEEANKTPPTFDELFAQYQTELLATVEVIPATAVRDKFVGPESNIQWPEEYRGKIEALYAMHVVTIRKATGRPNRSQGKLMETAATVQSEGA